MKESNGGFGPAYNVQISTDSAHGIIVAAEVTQHVDDYQKLIPPNLPTPLWLMAVLPAGQILSTWIINA